MKEEGEEAIERILKEVSDLTEKFAQIMERTGYVIMLSQTLQHLKDRLGGLFKDYYNQPLNSRGLALDFTQGEVGYSIFLLFQTVFLVLDDSTKYFGNEYRNIEGIHLNEVDGIDISSLGIKTIVPRSLETYSEGFKSVVSLEQIDELRLQELQSVGSMAYGDDDAINLVKDLIRESGGIQTESIFNRNTPS